MKNKIFLSFYTMILLLLMVYTIKAQNSTLNIELDKRVFVEGEPIFLLATLRNSGFDTLDYSGFWLSSGAFTLNIADQYGKSLPYYGFLIDYERIGPSGEQLSQGQSIQYICNVTSYYANFVENGVKYRTFPVVVRIIPGQYRVKAQFQAGQIKISSNELSFNVVAPQGDELKVFEALKKTFHPNSVWKKDQKERISVFQELSKSYAQSIYFPLIQRQLAGFCLSNGDTNEFNKILKSMIRTNHNNGYAMEAIKLIRLPVEKKEKLLNEIKLKNPQSRVVRFGENILISKSNN